MSVLALSPGSDLPQLVFSAELWVTRVCECTSKECCRGVKGLSLEVYFELLRFGP